MTGHAVIDQSFAYGDSLIHNLDPRARFVVATLASIVLAVCDDMYAVAAGVALGLVMAGLARLEAGSLLKRLCVVNLFMLLLVISMPPYIPGRNVFSLAGIHYSIEGLRRAILIAMKGNAIVLFYTALISTMPAPVLGHALAHLLFPKKLILLYLLMLRYINTVHLEYSSLRVAMRARCFRPRTDLHTMKCFGQVVGILLLRGFHRSRRVLAAMRSRCWRGEFWIYEHFHFSLTDGAFLVFAALGIGLLGWRQWG